MQMEKGGETENVKRVKWKLISHFCVILRSLHSKVRFLEKLRPLIENTLTLLRTRAIFYFSLKTYQLFFNE